MGFVQTVTEGFSPLRQRNFRIYLSGQVVSLVGTWLQITAQGWVVWELSRSEAALGFVNMLATLPLLLLGPWAGVLADRVDRRRLLIFTQAGAMLLAFVLALLSGLQVIQLWHVYVLALCLGTMTALDLPAQQAFLGDLSGMAEVRKAVNMNAMAMQVSRIIGPALAGFIVARLGASLAFGLNGLSFLAVIVSLTLVRAAQARRASTGTALGQLTEGLRYVRSHPRLQDLILFVVLVTFFALSALNILPSFASEVLKGDADTLGFLLSASGAGALLGTLFIVPWTQSARRTGLAIGGSVLWIGLWFFLFSFTTYLPLSMAALFFGSMGAPAVIATSLGLAQVMAPPEMRARLLSLLTMVSFGMQPLASLLIGFSAEQLGTPLAIRLNGLLLIGGIALMLGARAELRRWEMSRPQATPISAD
ncbi:MAG: MFS transporter [Chloroflexi bacterium]|nr:MFS transporter [Chloroflexota bacterium]